MLNAKFSEQFVPTKIGHVLAILGVWRYKVSIFTAKGTSVRESTSFEPFCVKIR